MIECKGCKEVKPYEAYYLRDGKPHGRKCKSCVGQHNAQWKKDNKDKVNAINRGYKERNKDRLLEQTREYMREVNHQRRAIIRGVDKMPKGYYPVLIEFYGKCLRCGSTESLTHDHVVPLAMGGEHSLLNAQVLCKSCNCKKWATDDTDYRDHSQGILIGLDEVGPVVSYV